MSPFHLQRWYALTRRAIFHTHSCLTEEDNTKLELGSNQSYGEVMNDQHLSASNSLDEPVFVLKYRSSIRAGIVFTFGFLIFYFWVSILILPAHNLFHKFFLKPFFGIFSLIPLFQLIDLLLFKELRLYRDRVVKVWKLLGTAEIRLANARLVGWGFSSLNARSGCKTC